VPSLPRIRRTRPARGGDAVLPARRRAAELTAHGLTWVHLDSPRSEEAQELSDRFGWHPYMPDHGERIDL